MLRLLSHRLLGQHFWDARRLGKLSTNAEGGRIFTAVNAIPNTILSSNLTEASHRASVCSINLFLESRLPVILHRNPEVEFRQPELHTPASSAKELFASLHAAKEKSDPRCSQSAPARVRPGSRMPILSRRSCTFAAATTSTLSHHSAHEGSDLPLHGVECIHREKNFSSFQLNRQVLHPE